MYELRVVALSEDARYVVLAPVLEGRRERYRVAVDDRLRAALRGELGRLERKIRPDSALTPREIQARVRAGETAETIAAAAGVAVEWVLRFETPVLAERAQVARQARHASLSVSGGEWTGVPLEEIVAARLESDGNRPDVAEWDAWRREDGRWVLQLRVGTFTAHWLWDPALARLVVHDDAARSLLHPDGPAAGPPARVAELRRLALAPDLPPGADSVADPRAESSLGLAEPTEADAAPIDLSSAAPGPATEAGEPPAAEPMPDPIGTAEFAPAETEPDLVAEPPEGAEDPGASGSAADPSRAVRRGGRRKSVPSWEDILLGTGANPGPGSGSETGSG